MLKVAFSCQAFFDLIELFSSIQKWKGKSSNLLYKLYLMKNYFYLHIYYKLKFQSLLLMSFTAISIRSNQGNRKQQSLSPIPHNQPPTPITQHTSKNQTNERDVSPQVKIYNRDFYLRKAQKQQLQQQYEHQIKMLANTPKISPSSYLILSQKIQQKLQKVFESIIGQQQQLTFYDLKKLLQELITNSVLSQEEEESLHSQLWIAMNSYSIQSQLNRHVCFAFFRILLDPYNLSIKQMKNLITKIPQLQSLEINREKLIQAHPEIKDQTLTVNKLLGLWKKKRCGEQQFNKRDKIQPEIIAFVPKINEKSKIIAQKQLQRYLSQNGFHSTNKPSQLQQYLMDEKSKSRLKEDTPYYEYLYQRKLQKDKFLKRSQPGEQDFVETAANSRTGTQQEISKIVKKLYYQPKRQFINPVQKKQQQELKKCSFKPKINNPDRSRALTNRSVSPIVKNFDKDIVRMNKARQEQKRKKTLLENLGKVKKPLENFKAPSFLDRDSLKLILEIKIDQERVQKIKLKGDEDPAIVAKKFVKKHDLHESMVNVLEQLLQQQLSSL